MNKLLIVGVCVALLGAAGCKPAADKEHKDAAVAPAEQSAPAEAAPAEMAPAVEAEPETKHAAVHWGYTGDEGPEHWAGLSPEFSACGEGQRQSPIDLTSATPISGDRLAIAFGKTFLSLESRARVMDLVDNGHTIQVSSNAEMSIDIGGKHYELVQYHFHAPSEHTIDGKYSPLEMHFVHESADGELAVMGALVEEGESMPFLDPIIAGLPSDVGDQRHFEDLKLNQDVLPPLPDSYFRYEGSLTTPPCSEGVHWAIAEQYYQAGADQIAAIASRLHNNNRPVRPLNERVLALVSVAE